MKRDAERREWGGLLAIFAFTIVVGGMTLVACTSRPTPTPQEPATLEAKDGETLPSLSAASLGQGEKLRVVATTNIVADVVSQIGGDAIALTALLPVGADPHTYEATPQDLRAVADAHVVFVNGLGLEEGLADLIGSAGGQAVVVPLSAGVETMEFGVEDEAGHEGEEHHHEGADPHVWFDPNNVIVWARNAEQTLSTLDPDNAAIYQANTEAYIVELQSLDGWIREQVTQVPPERRKLVTDHMVFGYFAQRYGFEQVGAVVGAFSAAAEPSAQDLAELEDKIRELGVPAIFVGTTVSPKLAEQIANDTDIQLVRIYTGSLSETDGVAGTYLDYERYNVDAIVGALR